MKYRLIVIENSLSEKSILTKYQTLSKTFFEKGTPQESFMIKIEIPIKDVNMIVNFLKHNLKYPYYAHLYHEDPTNNSLIVIFPGQIFHTSKTNFTDAATYGISHGIPKEQMDIQPRDVHDERW